MKKWCALAFVVLVLGVWVYREPIQEKIGYQGLRLYSRFFLKAEFECEAFRWRDREIEIVGAQFISPHGSLKLERVSIAYQPEWFQRILNLDVTLVEPNCTVSEESLSPDWLTPHPIFPFRKTRGRIEAKGGQVALMGEGTSPMRFDASMKLEKRFSGKMTVWEKEEEGAIAIQVAQGKHQRYHVATTFDQTPIKLVTAFLGNRKFTDDWEVKKGEVKGEVHLTFSPHVPMTATGLLQTSGVVLTHPTSETVCELGDATLNLNETTSSRPLSLTPFSLQGVLSIEKKSVMRFPNGYAIEQLGGTATFSPEYQTNVKLTGFCITPNEKKSLSIDLKSALGASDLTFRFHNREPQDAYLHLHSRDQNTFTLNLNHFDQASTQLTKSLFTPYLPELKQFEMVKGVINGALTGVIENQMVQEITLDDWSIDHVEVEMPQLNIVWGAESLKGNTPLHFSIPHPLEMLGGDCDIENGWISLASISSEWGTFHHINSKLRIHKGIVQNSSAEVRWGKLKGDVELNWHSPQDILRLSLSGHLNDLIPLLPQEVQQQIEEMHVHEHITIHAKMGRQINGLSLNGDLSLSNPLSQENEHFTFGLYFDKARNHLFTESPLILSQDSILPQLIQMVSPHFTHPLGHLPPNSPLTIGHFIFRNGWVEAHQTPFEKYLKPFISKEYTIKGSGHILSTFDLNELFIHYNTADLTLEHPLFAFHIDQLKTSHDAPLPALCHISLKDFSSCSYIPIASATFEDKTSSLHFNDLSGDFFINENQLIIPCLKGFCNGVHLTSEIHITQNEAPSIDLKFHKGDGKLSDLNNIATQLVPNLPLKNLPLDGSFSLRESGLHILINPDHTSVDLFASVSEAETTISPDQTAVKAISFNIEYNSEQDLLSIDDIYGTLLFGSPQHQEAYTLSGQGVHFDSLSKQTATFDFSLYDGKIEWSRINGSIFPADTKHGLEIAFNPSLTHLGELSPSHIEMLLTDWTTVDTLNFEIDFQLSECLHTFQRFQNSGFLMLTRQMIEDLNKIETIGGECTLNINYDNDTSRMTFYANGQNLLFNTHHFQSLLIHGYLKGDMWYLDQCQLDQTHLSAELSKHHEEITAHFIGLKYGQSLITGIEGSYNLTNQIIDGKINTLEIDLSHAHEWTQLSDFLRQSHIDGTILGNGSFHLERNREKKWGIESTFSLSHSAVEWNDFTVNPIHAFTVHAVLDKGVTLENYQATIQSTLKPERQISLHAEHITYFPKIHHLTAEHIAFETAANQLKWVENELSESFQIDTHLSTLKQEGGFKGTLDCNFNDTQTNFHIELADDIYTIAGQTREYKQIEVDLINNTYKSKALLKQGLHPFILSCESPDLSLREGVLTLQDLYPTHNYPPLKIHWTHTRGAPLEFHSLKGCVAGLLFDIDREKNQLMGSVEANGNTFSSILSQEARDIVSQWKIGKGYTFRGNWNFFTASDSPPPFPFTFEGTLEGENFQLKGYEFEHLNTHVSWGEKRITFNQLHLTDPSCEMKAKPITFTHTANNWTLTSPRIDVTNLSPSLLHEVGQPLPQAATPLLIRSLIVHSVQGNVSPKEQLTGYGTLHFVNPTGSNSRNLLFVIPTEIINRIGLNIGVLTPVKGQIDFDIGNGRFNLKRFKDMYSDRKMSKFYLSNTYPSFIDFDGNVFVQIGMKQYNLLFKLAELFTFTVRGTLNKPSYTLQKQHGEGNTRPNQPTHFSKWYDKKERD